jgi:hypothetical protein
MTDTIDKIIEEKGFHVQRLAAGSRSILSFTFGPTVKDEQFAIFLQLLDTALNEKKPFGLLIDTRRCKNVPVRASLMLTSWMRKRKPDIPGILLGFSVVSSSQIVISLINTAFHIQKPTSKHLITKDLENAKKFLNDTLAT